MQIHEPAPAVSPNLTAGLLLCARALCEPLELSVPSARAILSATGAKRSRAYELASELREWLPALVRSPGRPRAEAIAEPSSSKTELYQEALRFVMSHPGCVQLGSERGRYSEAWRLFVVELRDRHEDVPLSEFADALQMPLGTLEDWLRAPRPEPAEGDEGEQDDTPSEPDGKSAQIETVLAAWRSWSGGFGAFCQHLGREHRVWLSRTMLTDILFTHGERTPRRRARRTRDEHALRGAFETFFPAAEWVGDGKTLAVTLDGKVFHVNLELIVDAETDAAVGVAVTDEEDGAAVTEAFESGVTTTGAAPLALLLDNRPSNHTPEVDEALGDTLLIRATAGRPENKAHVEGSFGLFAQKVPPIELDTHEPRALARALATIVALTFFRAINRAPRRDRGGRSRVDLYGETVTPEAREAARAALRERLRKQERARQTRHARLDPEVCALLDDAFRRLCLIDPDRHIRDAIACYSRDEIVDALAIFDGKREAGTLPEGVDARYLFGIVKNLHHMHEADAITHALLRERLSARDRFLKPLIFLRDEVLAAATDLSGKLRALCEHLVGSDRELDRHFWIEAITQAVATCDETTRRALAERAARRIHAAFGLGTRERHRLVQMLLRNLWPLA